MKELKLETKDYMMDKYSIRLFVKEMKHFKNKGIESFRLVIESSENKEMVEYLIKCIRRSLGYSNSLKFNSYISVICQYRKRQEEWKVLVENEFNNHWFRFDWRTLYVWACVALFFFAVFTFQTEIKLVYNKVHTWIEIKTINEEIIKQVEAEPSCDYMKELTIYYSKHGEKIENVLWEMSESIYVCSFSYKLKPKLIIDIIRCESKFKKYARAQDNNKYSCNAQGFMQVNCDVWKIEGGNPFDTYYNIKKGCEILQYNLARTKGNTFRAMIHYNGGSLKKDTNGRFVITGESYIYLENIMNSKYN